MEKKKAIVLDTNFVIAELPRFGDMLKNLREIYNVYLTQISVDERKEQQCRDFLEKLDQFNKFITDYDYLISIKVSIDCSKELAKLRKMVQTKYEAALPNHIIPFNASKSILETALDRANKKIPPFVVEAKSDKGFKDTLIWLSILEYFKDNGENDVVFLTNDGGFLKASERLAAEFNERTGKNIEILENGFYAKLLAPKESEGDTAPKIEQPLPDSSQMRERINRTIYSLCWVEGEDYWGNLQMDKAFTLTKMVDSEVVESVFGGLKQLISDNIFEKALPSDKVFAPHSGIINGVPIPMENLESALSLFNEIQKKWKDYLPQFYNVVVNIINGSGNLAEFQELEDDDGELPF